jgi:uncharacterized membrane protein YfcA
MPVLFVVIGLVAGLLAGVFGIGGGIVIVPALTLWMGMAPRRAVGTSIGALLLPVGILAARQYWKEGNIDVRGALLIALGVTAGAYFSARFSAGIASATLQKGFAVLLLVVAVRMWVRAS